MIYLDTGCLLKLYYPEPESARVVRLVGSSSLAFIALHELELANALELKLFRREARASQVAATQAMVQQDVGAGTLYRLPIAWEDVWVEAQALARAHTRSLGCRSLDIVHCAAAKLLSASSFITTDGRQRSLALAIGLASPRV